MTTQPLQFAGHGKHGSHGSHPGAFGNRNIPIIPGPSRDKQHEQLKKQAEKWVAQTFYGQMLKQMRNSPFKDKMFSGGRGGEAFGEMFDQQLADRMSKGAGGNLVDAIVSKLEQKKATSAYQNAPKPQMSGAVNPSLAVATFHGVA
jgi:Rod binding domain-containing protein